MSGVAAFRTEQPCCPADRLTPPSRCRRRCAGGLWLSMACDGTAAAPKQYPPTDTEDNVALYGPFALASPCVDQFNLNIKTGTIDACSAAAAAAEQGAAAAAGTAPTAGDDPTFIGSDGLAYHVRIAMY